MLGGIVDSGKEMYLSISRGCTESPLETILALLPKPHERLVPTRTFRNLRSHNDQCIREQVLCANELKKNVLEVNGLVKALLSPPQLLNSRCLFAVLPPSFRRAFLLFLAS